MDLTLPLTHLLLYETLIFGKFILLNTIILSSNFNPDVFFLQPCLLQSTWFDPQVQLEHVPSVLQGVRQGYWFQEVGLILQYVLLTKIHNS